MDEPIDTNDQLEQIHNQQHPPANVEPADKNLEAPSKHAIDHLEFGTYADSTLQKSTELGEGIVLSIVGYETRGNSFTKYVVYHIVGEDKNGAIDVFRRFNQFYKMRIALVKRFPGCFVPSIPEKSISLVDGEVVNKRKRYLRDFVRKMTQIPHLYNSEQFQALLRSKEKDITSTFQKWPNPSTSDIINKYRESFGDLAGKVITNEVRIQIHDFGKLIIATEKHISTHKNIIKQLAMSRDKFNKNLPLIFSKYLPSYEHQCLVELVKDEQQLLSINQSEAKFLEHEAVSRQSLKDNPYWLLYDLIKHEERDGRAFLQSIKAIEQYQNKKYELQVKFSQNNKTINELVLSKKSSSEQKYKLEVENESLKKEKEAVECLTDIIIALIAFVELQKFKKEKNEFYKKFLGKLGGYEINMVQNMVQVWKDWNKKTFELLHRFKEM